MKDSTAFINEKIIKNKSRVQNHGEVFTPRKVINKMLDLPNIRQACQNLASTFLEPSAGEGAFLVEVLNRKLKTVEKDYSNDIITYENYSLLALSSLYGVELLEDNAQKCVMNMYQVYYESYRKKASLYDKKIKDKVLNSAKLIISKNIIQGNFITKLSNNNSSLIFSEWKPLNIDKKSKTLTVQRTEYSLEDILKGSKNERGVVSSSLEKEEQLDLFSLLGEESKIKEEKIIRYLPVRITEVYKERIQEIDE